MNITEFFQRMNPTDRGLLIACLVLFWPVTATALGIYVAWKGIGFMGTAISNVSTAAKAAAEREEEKLQLQEAALRQQEYQIELDAKREQRKHESRRRQTAQARVEFLYSSVEPELKERFSRKQLQQHMKTFLGDGLCVEDVERHADSLERLIHSHQKKTDPSATDLTIQALKQAYEQRTAEINEATPGDTDEDERLREFLLNQLKEHYEQQLERFITSQTS